MNAITIRRLQPDDAVLGAKALNELKLADEREARPAREVWCRSFLCEERNVLIVALSGKEPVGFMIAHLLDRAEREAPMLLLYEIEVSPAHRRRGVGRALIERLKRIGREHAVFKMWVLTDRANLAARRLYRSCGGAESGENLLIEWSEDRLP